VVDPVADTVKVEYVNSTGALMQKVMMRYSPDVRHVSQKTPNLLTPTAVVSLHPYRCTVKDTKETKTFSKTTRYTITCEWNGFVGDSEHRYSGA
jgi:hypothetical protein